MDHSLIELEKGIEITKMPSQEELSHWLRKYIADLIGESYDSIRPDAQFLAFDLDSIDSVRMALELERDLDVNVPPEIFLDGLTTIEECVGLITHTS